MPSPVDAFLIIWARWSATRNDNGLGFAHSSAIYRIMQEGLTGAGICTPYQLRQLTDCNELAERVEVAVLALPERPRIVVCFEYLKSGVRKDKAKRLHCSEEAFRARLRRAKGLLTSQLGVRE